MPCWYYDKKELRDTPSILDGISFEKERRYRKEGARFIMNCGTNMGLGHNTMATGVVYFHRFYMLHSFKSFPRYVTACCCLFLAGKVEETPKKCRDIIKTARALLTDNYFYSFGEDPKEEVMTLERILLQTIKFDLQVEHPYTFLLKYAKCLKGDQQKLQKMVQMAWNFVNDSLSTVVCLQWEPEIIAVALIHLASKLSKFTVLDWVGRQPHHVRWWDMFVLDVTMEILEDICHQVLDLYQNQKESSETATMSPPQKPPSRADSPPTVSKAQHQSSFHKSRSGVSSSTLTNSSINDMANIQSIKSLGSGSGAGNSSITSTGVSSIPSTNDHMSSMGSYHMYGIHSMYSNIQPPLPPPPPPLYGSHSSNNSWSTSLAPPPPMNPPPHYSSMHSAQMPSHSSTHRPPPPHHHHSSTSANSGYYSSGNSSYSRQRY